MKCYNYIDKPALNSFIVEELYDQLKFVNNVVSPYMVVEGSSVLYHYASQLFGQKKMYVGIQIITGNLPPHIDVNADKTDKYNYILEPGGDSVVTSFFDKSDQLIDQVVIGKDRWHFIDVTTKHSVSNIISRRLSLMVGVYK